jgi:sec-independent protein translocase protein TatA
MRLGPWEIGLIVVIILIVFGVGKLPQVGSAIGKGIRSFKKAQSGEDEDTEEKSQQDTGDKAKKGS